MLWHGDCLELCVLGQQLLLTSYCVLIDLADHESSIGISDAVFPSLRNCIDPGLQRTHIFVQSCELKAAMESMHPSPAVGYQLQVCRMLACASLAVSAAKTCVWVPHCTLKAASFLLADLKLGSALFRCLQVHIGSDRTPFCDLQHMVGNESWRRFGFLLHIRDSVTCKWAA